MFFRDMLDQTGKEFHYKDGFYNKLVVLIPVIMKSKKTLKRINGLIKDIQRSTFEGIRKPEPLKENLRVMWSRRIDDTNRIIYFEKDEIIYIVSCKGHYDD